MADARSRAEALAKLAGVKLGKVLNISMSSGGGYADADGRRTYGHGDVGLGTGHLERAVEHRRAGTADLRDLVSPTYKKNSCFVQAGLRREAQTLS